jgi:hypothetical protein
MGMSLLGSWESCIVPPSALCSLHHMRVHRVRVHGRRETWRLEFSLASWELTRKPQRLVSASGSESFRWRFFLPTVLLLLEPTVSRHEVLDSEKLADEARCVLIYTGLFDANPSARCSVRSSTRPPSQPSKGYSSYNPSGLLPREDGQHSTSIEHIIFPPAERDESIPIRSRGNLSEALKAPTATASPLGLSFRSHRHGLL